MGSLQKAETPSGGMKGHFTNPASHNLLQTRRRGATDSEKSSRNVNAETILLKARGIVNSGPCREKKNKVFEEIRMLVIKTNLRHGMKTVSA